MRNFSELEKKIIQEIIKTENLDSNILNIISKTFLINKAIDIKENEMIILFYKLDKNAINELFEIISLLKYLEKNYLIFIHNNYNYNIKENWISSNITKENFNQNSSNYKVFKIPEKIAYIILGYRKNYLFPATELKKLVENKFKTNEQIYNETVISLAIKSKKLEIEDLKNSNFNNKISLLSLKLIVLSLIFSMFSDMMRNFIYIIIILYKNNWKIFP